MGRCRTPMDACMGEADREKGETCRFDGVAGRWACGAVALCE